MPSEQELNAMRDQAQDQLFSMLRRLEGRHMDLEGKVDIMASVMVTKQDVEELKGKIHELLTIQNALSGTKTFAGWLKDGLYYLSVVGAALTAVLHFGWQFIHNIGAAK